MILAGSFIQLPPVPSLLDPGLFAFQSSIFNKVFPHKVILHVVVHQDSKDIIDVINELCLGSPSQHTIKFMKSLQCPIAQTDSIVHIFGTNFAVDMFNHCVLDKMQGRVKTFYSIDKGVKKLLKLSSFARILALKEESRVIITHNLENGLVNGLSATIN